MDDYATPNANNPSSDLQLCTMEINSNLGCEQTNISYGNDGRISAITMIYHNDTESDSVSTCNITYGTNKIIFSNGGNETDFIFNNELHSYSAETINNQVFHCISIINM